MKDAIYGSIQLSRLEPNSQTTGFRFEAEFLEDEVDTRAGRVRELATEDELWALLQGCGNLANHMGRSCVYDAVHQGRCATPVMEFERGLLQKQGLLSLDE